MPKDMYNKDHHEEAIHLATDSVDEEIAHHPELLAQRSTLLKAKIAEYERDLNEKEGKFLEEMNRGGLLIKEIIEGSPYKNEISQELLEKLESPWDEEKLTFSENLMQEIYGQAIRLQEMGNHNDALYILKYLQSHYPNLPDLRVALGYSQLCLQRNKEALESFEKSIELEPENLRGYYLAAYVYHHEKEDDLALQKVEAALTFRESPSFKEWGPSLLEIQNMLELKEVIL